MNQQLVAIDISSAPDLVHIVEEVRATGEPRLLRRGGEDVALLMPVPGASVRRKRRAKSDADRAAALSSFGGWKGLVDARKLKRDLTESRRIPPRPPIEM